MRQIGSVLGVALAIVLVGRDGTLAAVHVDYLFQAGFAVATALFCLPVDTRPRT